MTEEVEGEREVGGLKEDKWSGACLLLKCNSLFAATT